MNKLSVKQWIDKRHADLDRTVVSGDYPAGTGPTEPSVLREQRIPARQMNAAGSRASKSVPKAG